MEGGISMSVIRSKRNIANTEYEDYFTKLYHFSEEQTSRVSKRRKKWLYDVYNSFQSWLAHSYLACSYKTRKSMLKLYDELFDGYRITKKFWHLVNIKKERKECAI